MAKIYREIITSAFKRCFKLKIALITVCLYFFFFATRAEQIITFGIYTSDKASTMYKIFKPLLKKLQASVSETSLNR